MGGAPHQDIVERTQCRVCGSSSLQSVMDFGEQAIAGVFPPRGSMRSPRYPLELVRCRADEQPDACGLVQLRHSVSSHLLYDSYWYRSGINRTMTENLHEIAHQAADLVGGLREGDLVLDIGCNDGTLLDGYLALAADGVDYLGIDPSDVTRYAVEKGYRVITDLFDKEAFLGAVGDRRARVITSIAMFYDLESPRAFAADVAACLADDGVWVTEFSYMPTMLEMNSFDTVCHEHLEYYSLAVIERVLASADLEVARVELNDVNGGSIRIFAGHRGRHTVAPDQSQRLAAMREREEDLALGTPAPYLAFKERCEQVREDLVALLRRLRDEEKVVHIYGASTKGNTTLQYCGIDTDLIPFAADRNPDKWHSETIGTGIPIISEADSRAQRPDYYFVLPWHFLDEMLEREAEFFARGGQFIIPLPDVRLIDAADATP
jgi:SAM-dependent methyltransferase